MRVIIYSLLATITIIGNLASCRSTKGVANSITIESGEIPPDMAKEDFTIIGILHGKKGYDNYVIKNFADYPGKSVTAALEEVPKKYKDVEKYRYLMDAEEKKERTSMTNSRGMQDYTYTTSFRYYIIDRKTGKTYTRKSSSSFFSKEMIAYLKAVDAVRRK